MKAKLLFVVNVDWFFISHRMPIAIAAIQDGYEVHIACGITEMSDILEANGIIVHPLPLERGRTGLGNILKTILRLISVCEAVRPDILHLVTIKPVLFGGIVARLLGVKRVVAAISGLGFVFIDQGLLARIRRFLVARLYRWALCHPLMRVVFQNADDCQRIMSMVPLDTSQIVMIKGSGVDLGAYIVNPEPDGVPVVMMAARILRDKGVIEFCEAATAIRSSGVQARFCIVGSLDPDNPAALSAEECDLLSREHGVEFWGHRDDMPQVLSSANIIVLPSYREGFPKVLIEAAACGRAVVTTDVPGCRDAIEDGVTGLLVPVRNAVALSQAIGVLLDDSGRRRAMGLAGRVLAEREFNIENVVRQHLAMYSELMATA